ncbi:NAD(P)/FAD-dependent oxidoreductase [Streptomyces sp. NPDC005811]|uniref:FAD-dependent oxidoreductase n=1 Tax=Streptomyces sp. NPDC005811 TaxID=3154565 RepID=UPI0033E48458
MPRALVVGGGIAGPVTAMALQKAGFETTVYEAFERTADGVGAFMNIAPNGLNALECLDLADVVRGAGFDTPAMAFYRHDGRRLTGDIAFDRVRGTGNTTVQRSDLYIALREEAERRGIPIEYDSRITEAKTVDGTVLATFADGRQLEGDFLVGADGLNSRVRTIIDPAAPSPRYVGVLNAWGLLPAYPTREAPGVIRMFFGRKCFFMYTQAPSGELRWYANPPREVRPDPASLRGGDAWRDELVGLFRRDRMPVADIIRVTPDVPAPFLNCDLPSLTRWHRDRMIVIGDAAHAASPTSGSGASIAMEDAVTLAKCLRDSSDPDEAFRRFEAVRRTRVEAVVAQGKRNIEGNLSGPVRSLVRNHFIARTFRKPASDGRRTLWMHEHRIDWDAPVESAGAEARA